MENLRDLVDLFFSQPARFLQARIWLFALINMRILALILLGSFAQVLPIFSQKPPIDSVPKTTDSATALSFLKEKQGLAKKLQQSDDLEKWAKTVSEIFRFFAQQNQPEKSLEESALLLKKIWRQPQTNREATALIEVYVLRGFTYSKSLGNLRKSLQEYEIAHELDAKFPKNEYDVAEKLFKPLGNHYTRLGDNTKSVAILSAGVARAKTPKSKTGLYNNLALALWNIPDLPAAKDALQLGLAVSDAPPLQLAHLQGTLAQIFLSENKPLEAQKACQAGSNLLKTIAEKTIQVQEATMDNFRTSALCAMALQDFPIAEKNLKWALDAAKKRYGDDQNHREIAKIHLTQATLEQKKGKSETAFALCDTVLTHLVPNFRPKSHFDLPSAADLFEENSICEALIHKANIASDWATATRDIRYLHLAANCFELAWKTEMKLRNRYIYSSSRLEIQADARIRASSEMEVYHQLYTWTKDGIWAERAFALAERSKGLLLMELLQDKLIDQRVQGTDFSLLDAMRQEIANLEVRLSIETNNLPIRLRLDSLNTQFAQQLATSRQTHRNLPDGAWFESNNPRTLKRAGLHTDEALLEYFFQDSVLNIFAFMPNRPIIWERTAFAAAEKSNLQEFLHFFTAPNNIAEKPKAFLRLAHQLWTILLPQEVQHSSSILIVPDGILGYVPFDALLPEPSNDLASAVWAIEKYSIRHAFSYSSLVRQVALPAQAKHFFFGFAPVFAKNERGNAALPFSSSDWATLGFFTDKYTLIGEKATKQELVRHAGNFSVLHLASHTSPFGADFRMACFDDELWLNEMYMLRLNARLVVLSSCETSLGENQQGEGILSNAHAFTIAGSAATLSGLWKIGEKNTSELFQRFYENLAAGQPPSKAIRAAKIAHVQNKNLPVAYRTPYYWAGMVFNGADAPIQMEYAWWKFILLTIGVISIGFGFLYFFQPKYLNRKSNQQTSLEKVNPSDRQG